MSERKPARSCQGGFLVVEAMIALLVLAVALLAHATSVGAEYNLAKEEPQRMAAVHAASEFLERLRADEDKAGLYGRLLTYALEARDGGTLNPGEARLADGRRAYAPNTYFPYFVTSRLVDLHLLVDVPIATPADPANTSIAVLREDLPNVLFGLPADLNADGVIDETPKDDDYYALPVRIYVRWQPPGGVFREVALTAWIASER